MFKSIHCGGIKVIPELGCSYYLLKDKVRGCDTVLIENELNVFGMFIRQTGGFLPMLKAPAVYVGGRRERGYDTDSVERI